MILIKGVGFPHTCEECPCFSGEECKAMKKPASGGIRPKDCPVRPTVTHKEQMYICDYCGGVFSESEKGVIKEREGDKYNYGYLYFPCCPYCGSESYSEAEECDICADHSPASDVLHLHDMSICGNCAEQIKKMRPGTAKQ